jgi:hypothetical protein
MTIRLQSGLLKYEESASITEPIQKLRIIEVEVDRTNNETADWAEVGTRLGKD